MAVRKINMDYECKLEKLETKETKFETLVTTLVSTSVKKKTQKQKQKKRETEKTKQNKDKKTVLLFLKPYRKRANLNIPFYFYFQNNYGVVHSCPCAAEMIAIVGNEYKAREESKNELSLVSSPPSFKIGSSPKKFGKNLLIHD